MIGKDVLRELLQRHSLPASAADASPGPLLLLSDARGLAGSEGGAVVAGMWRATGARNALVGLVLPDCGGRSWNQSAGTASDFVHILPAARAVRMLRIAMAAPAASAPVATLTAPAALAAQSACTGPSDSLTSPPLTPPPCGVVPTPAAARPSLPAVQPPAAALPAAPMASSAVGWAGRVLALTSHASSSLTCAPMGAAGPTAAIPAGGATCAAQWAPRIVAAGRTVALVQSSALWGTGVVLDAKGAPSLPRAAAYP